MDTYRAVVDKRDQRAFLDRPIPDEVLRRILQAGRMTGSSKNVEPNRFVVVRDRPLVAALAAPSAYAHWLGRAAVVIVLVQTRAHAFDAGRCAQNLMLAAWNDGIGSSAAHPPRARGGARVGLPPALSVNRVIGLGPVDPGRARPPASVARRRLPLTEL